MGLSFPLVAFSAHERPPRIIRPMAPSTFVGRDSELALLEERLAATRHGQGSIVAVTGEAGIGKTHLLEEFAAHAAGVRTAWARGTNLAGAPPYLPWTELVGALLSPQLQAELRARSPRSAGVLLAAAAPSEAQDARVEPWELAEFLRAALRLVARDPVLLLMDDVQWFDTASLRLLADVARDLGTLPVLVVVAFRPDDEAGPVAQLLEEASRARVVRRATLGGLQPEDLPRLVADVTTGPVSPAFARALVDQTGGNPYFLRELAPAVTGSRGTPVDAELPANIRDVLLPRFSSLRGDEREWLALAALLGKEFALRLWSTATGTSVEAMAALADGLVRSSVLRELGAGTYRFAHDLMREAALDGFSATRRAMLHAALARRLMLDAGTDTGVLAWHLREGARVQPDLARPAFELAFATGEQARRIGACERADRHFSDCLELLDDGLAGSDLPAGRERLLYLRGVCRIAAGEGRAAFRDLMTASEQMREQGDWAGQARAALDISRMFIPSGRAIEVLTAALDAPGVRDPHLEALAMIRRARLRDVDADPEVAAAVRLAPDLDALELRAEVGSYRGRRAFLRQEFELAASLLDEAARLFEGLGEHAAATDERRWLHDCYLYLGDLPRMMALYERFIHYARRTGQRVNEHVWLGDSGAMATLAGDFALARRRARESSPEIVYVAHSARIALAEATGELDGIADTLPDPAQVGGARSLTGHVHMHRARAQWLAGNIQAARAELAAVERYFDDDYLGHGIFNMDGVLQVLGSDSLVERTYALLERYSAVRVAIWANADRVRGTLALRLGRPDDAEHHVRRGLAWCEANGAGVEAARCLASLAEIARARGQVTEAARLLSTAADRFGALGAAGYQREALDQLAALRRPVGLPAGLSPREAEILRLVAAGMTNRQIAKVLVLSPNTVANHVKHILNKTGLANRAEAAAFAATHGLAARTGTE